MLYLNLGDVFFQEGMLKAAINQYETAGEISKRFKINVGLFTSSLKLGNVYAVLGEDDLARKHYTEALRGFDYLGMTAKSIDVYGKNRLLESKNIASLMNISAASVKVARSRLRKKLDLDMTSNLSAFITQI